MSIGTLSEKSLHAGLKQWYGRPSDQFEVAVDGYVIDIQRGDTLIEIQTRHLGAMKRKLAALLPNHRVRLLHPIAQEKWIVRETADHRPISRRKSPKRGQVIDIFRELIHIPHLLRHPNLTVELLLVQVEEIWRDDQQGSWRRKRWSIADRRLLGVIEQVALAEPADFLALLPAGLPAPFTNRDLAAGLGCSAAQALKVTYTLRQLGLLEVVGKQGNSLLHQRMMQGQVASLPYINTGAEP
jgi:hypothetical protein